MSDSGVFEARRRPRWQRRAMIPRVWLAHYRLMRVHAGRWDSAVVAWKMATLLWPDEFKP